MQRGLFAKRPLPVGAVHLRYWGAPLTRKEVCPLSLSLVLPSLSLSRSGVCAHVTLSVRVFLCVCFAGCVCVRVFRWQVVSTRSRYVATLRNGTGIDGKAVPESLARLVNDGPAPNCEFDEQACVLHVVNTQPLAKGEQLSIDYGADYWQNKKRPTTLPALWVDKRRRAQQ